MIWALTTCSTHITYRLTFAEISTFSTIQNVIIAMLLKISVDFEIWSFITNCYEITAKVLTNKQTTKQNMFFTHQSFDDDQPSQIALDSRSVLVNIYLDSSVWSSLAPQQHVPIPVSTSVCQIENVHVSSISAAITNNFRYSICK